MKLSTSKKPNQTIPLVATLAPAAAVAPPLLIVAAIGAGLLWLFSKKKEEPTTPPPAVEKPAPIPMAGVETTARHTPARQPQITAKRITREDVAQSLEYGVRPVERMAAVAALQALGFQKTAAYKALSPDGRFADLLEHASDGRIEWKG